MTKAPFGLHIAMSAFGLDAGQIACVAPDPLPASGIVALMCYDGRRNMQLGHIVGIDLVLDSGRRSRVHPMDVLGAVTGVVRFWPD